MLTPAQRWALAVSTHYFRVNNREPSFLTGAQLTPEQLEPPRKSLANQWGANNRDDLLTRLDFLANQGHRSVYNEICALDDATIARRGPYRDVNDNIEDEESRDKIVFVRKHRHRIGPRTLLMWDAARAGLIASWGVELGWLTVDEAMSYLVSFAMLIQRTHDSWKDVHESFLLGREFWNGSTDARFQKVGDDELAKPTSLWNTCPWGTDLSMHGVQMPLRQVWYEPPTPPPHAPTQASPVYAGSMASPSAHGAPPINPTMPMGAGAPSGTPVPPMGVAPMMAAPLLTPIQRNNTGLIVGIIVVFVFVLFGAAGAAFYVFSGSTSAPDAKPPKTAPAPATAAPKRK